VHVSSWMVYGVGRGGPAREDFVLRPFREPLGMTKADGDRAVQRMIADNHLPAVILRPGTFFGPGDNPQFGRIADRLRAGEAIIVGPGDNALPLVYITDVVHGLLLALDHEHAVGQAFNLASDQPLTQQQFLEAIASEIGARPPRIHIPHPALYTVAVVAEQLALIRGTQPVVSRLGVMIFGTDNRLAIDKAQRELGYRPQISLRDGVRLTAAWYLAQRRPDADAPSATAGA